jgi:uncharacterized membrane-anchored protein
MRSNDPSMQDLIRFAQSPAAQQLMTLLQQNGGAELQEAMNKAAAGDYTQAKEALSALLKDPEARMLLQQLGR